MSTHPTDQMPTGLTAQYKTTTPEGLPEVGYVLLPAAGPLNGVRRPYLSTFGDILHLRDDEIRAVIFPAI